MPDGRTLGHYRLERVLGTGTFATVWLAHDELVDRDVAIKLLADNWARNLDVTRRFRSEARVLLTAESPRIVRGFHVGESPDGAPYLVMGWADRGTLAERIDRRAAEGRAFDARETVSILREIALAIADLHALGHLHRDVKPSNVLIRSSPAGDTIGGLDVGERVVLGDFGLARALDQSALTLVAGSPGYVAPEQASGLSDNLTTRADLYPLGRIGLEMLTGRRAGAPTTMAAAAKARIDAGDTLDGAGVHAPASLVALLDELVQHQPAKRPATAAAVAGRLDLIVQSLTVDHDDEPAPPIEPARGWATRRLLVVAAFALALATLATGLAIANRGADPDSTGATTAPTTEMTATPATVVAVTTAATAISTGAQPTPAPDVTDGAGLPAATLPSSDTSAPLPPFAVYEGEPSDALIVANVASDVGDVVAFYLALEEVWTVKGDPTTDGRTTTLTLESATTTATVTVTPTAQSASRGISKIEIRQTRRDDGDNGNG